MSWKSGSSLMENIIGDFIEQFPDDLRKEIYEILINNFENFDCDTLYQCCDDDEAFEEAFYSIHPDEREEYYDEDDE
jgi:hypothetical protein